MMPAVSNSLMKVPDERVHVVDLAVLRDDHARLVERPVQAVCTRTPRREHGHRQAGQDECDDRHDGRSSVRQVM